MNTDRQIMKIAAFIALVLLPFTGIAQNYQCLQAGVKHYFTNSNGYLRGIRIDSVNSYADSTVFYPYRTPRGRFYKTELLDTAGGSWLGKKVIQLNNGTFLFDNIWGDTAIVKTQAHLGDTWILYDDTTTLFYQAEVLAEDTMTVLGNVDSVKKILITARNPSGIVTTDPVNGIQLILSKNNGFVQAFDLFTFPYHAPDSLYRAYAIDYFLDFTGGPSVTNSVFRIVPFHWPANTEMYNWDIGDAYEYRFCETIYGGGCAYPYSFRYDSVIGRTFSSGKVTYQVVGWKIEQHYLGFYHTGTNYSYWKTDNSRTFNVAGVPYFDTLMLPEETRQPEFYWWIPGDNSHCMSGVVYSRMGSYIVGQSVNIPFEATSKSENFKLNFELISSYQSTFEFGTGDMVELSDDLIYSSRGGVKCGNYIGPESLSVHETENVYPAVGLSPNPAGDELTITSTEKTNELVIIDIVGRAVYKGNYHTDKVQIDISHFPPGMYIARINGAEPVKFIKQ